MKTRSLCLSLLLLTVAACQVSTRSYAYDENNWCGTPYPGWWHHISDPSRMLDIDVQKIVQTEVDYRTGVATYKITLAVKDESRRNSPAARLVLNHDALSTANGRQTRNGFAVDAKFNPNNANDAYKILSRESEVILLPAVQAGKSAFCDGSVRLSLDSNVQELFGKVAR